ncbi:hypothetical protein EV189_3493 [Motilibacter rhizosphaerae]|uniref:Polyketide cyclase/dehydrase/lipid transport protein n=1 Tax=Motilibacter rhizosphaerae TaxID=598652 RepID=A0A4V2F2T5_9ACTN|nr:hypothetical protein [Motilibacter rhizosphaerae]RZS80014.1 hypothetical protein EV189_3493 [Motilibacter rhizosphaerae]
MPSTTIRCERSMPAPAEVAYEVATDPAQLHRWVPVLGLPEGEEPALQVDRANLRASWGHGSGYAGHLQVEDADAGTSVVRLDLEFAGGAPDSAEELVGQALDLLAGEVETRVDDAS